MPLQLHVLDTRPATVGEVFDQLRDIIKETWLSDSIGTSGLVGYRSDAKFPLDAERIVCSVDISGAPNLVVRVDVLQKDHRWYELYKYHMNTCVKEHAIALAETINELLDMARK